MSAAFFEAVAQRLLPSDVYVKRATSRVLLQFMNLAQGKPQVSETLLHDLLFFCAQPAVVSAATTPHLAAVRETFEEASRALGDAFRGGLMKGMAAGLPLQVCAQLGSVAATYALEHLGGQSHAYTMEEFTTRYEAHFGPLESNVPRSEGRQRHGDTEIY